MVGGESPGLTHPIKMISNILLKPCLILIRDSDAAQCMRSQILVIGSFPGAAHVLPVSVDQSWAMSSRALIAQSE